MKTIFIITGFKQNKEDIQFKWMYPYFSEKGFRVKIFAPNWNFHVMSDYVNEFVEFYGKNKSDVNYVLGFSFGAMTAFISAPVIKPSHLYLCSLSPYFKEDLTTLKQNHAIVIGIRRLKDFSNHGAKEIAKLLHNIPIDIFYGENEAEKYPRLKNRCILTHKALPNSKLTVVKNASHKINHLEYVKAIKSQFR